METQLTEIHTKTLDLIESFSDDTAKAVTNVVDHGLDCDCGVTVGLRLTSR